MAAKEKKSNVSKHLKEIQGEKEKVKRNRKNLLAADNRVGVEEKNGKGIGRKRKRKNDEIGQSTPLKKRARKLETEQEDWDAAKASLLGSVKLKKGPLEKELGDLLENATGRNTPSFPRNKKMNEKEEDGSEGSDEKTAIILTKTRKGNDKELEDDNISIKSLSMPSRGRKANEKETDEDSLSSKSLSGKSKKNDGKEEDVTSVKNLIRPNLITRTAAAKKKKSVLAAIAVKKKIFIKRKNQRKAKEVSESKSKHLECKKMSKIKGTDKSLVEAKQKRMVKKPLKFQSKLKDQSRIRPTLAIKNQKVKKAKLKLTEKSQTLNLSSEGTKETASEQSTCKERLKSENQLLTGSLITRETVSNENKSKYVRSKRKCVKREEKSDKSNDVYFFSEDELPGAQEQGAKRRQKVVKLNQNKTKFLVKKNLDGRKQRRESGIHFETTKSPDDSSVIIVQPRLGPKIKGKKRLKPLLPKGKEPGKRGRQQTKDLTQLEVIPNYNQISNSFFVQSIPNFNLFSANSAIISYTPHSETKSNFNSSSTLSDLTATLKSNVSPNKIIVTPSGVLLSESRLITPNNQGTSAVCCNGPPSNSFTETLKKDLVCSAHGMEHIPGTGLIYQSSTTVIQPRSCSNSNSSLFIKRPDIICNPVDSPSNIENDSCGPSNSGELKVNKSFTSSFISEKLLADEFNLPEITVLDNSLRSLSKISKITSKPVAKNVNELLLLKKKSIEKEIDGSYLENDLEIKTNGTQKNTINTVLAYDKVEKEKKEERRLRKRRLKNVRRNANTEMDLTFSEPESSSIEKLDEFKNFQLRKSSSFEVLNELYQNKNLKYSFTNELLMNENFFESPSVLCANSDLGLINLNERFEEGIEKKEENTKESSPKIKEAVEVCRFSKENEKALKELGLDSDLDQTKSENDCESPFKTGKTEESKVDVIKKTRIKEEVDTVLREMPIRKVTNLYRSPKPTKMFGSRTDFKQHLIHKSSDYLSLSPSKPPTVIDKLLEKNKSLKKAEEEGKFNSATCNLIEKSFDFDISLIKSKKNQREGKTKKYPRGFDSKRISQKRLTHENSVSKVYGRRGSNPEIYSNNFVSVKSQVANENVPIRQILEMQDLEFSQTDSINYESMQKVINRRCSLPLPAEDFINSKFSKSLDDVNKLKTENFQTVFAGSRKQMTTENAVPENQPRVINIVTSNSGVKKGKNLLDEVRFEIESCKKAINGEVNERKESTSNSQMFHSLMNGLSNERTEDKLSQFEEEKEKKGANKRRFSSERKKEKKAEIVEESPEDLVTKETILSALGLQSLKSAQIAQKKKESQIQQSACQSDGPGYTGTLKAVIKIQRQEKKGSSKTPVKMVYKASSTAASLAAQSDDHGNVDDAEATSTEDAEESISEENKNGNGKAKSLVIPEKASSFSIHPGRMCSDVCTYCFGKFGLLDTPCHIAQLKDADKRRNILATEVHLTADSCLCDACFRHVDKKSNCPTFSDKRSDMKRRGVRKQSCMVQNCNADSQHNIKRKLFLKLKKSIGRKLVLDAGKLEKLQPGQSLTFCNRHIYWIDYFMSCGICKKRLTSINMYRVTSAVMELNAALSLDEIPAILTENRFLCKICNCFSSIRIRFKDPNEMSSSHRQFYETCRKRILKCHGMDVPDSEPEVDCKNGVGERKALKKTRKSTKPTATVTYENSKSDNDVDMSMEEMDKTNESEKCEKELDEVSHLNIPPKANGNLDFGGVSITPTTTEVNPTQIHVKLGNLNIGALGNLNIGQDVRHGGRSGEVQCFPTETELALRAHFDLQPSAEDESAKTARKGFEKCTTTIQFNSETKTLFYNLQMPYGNQSSFFRHLILLEKYFRSGDLVISKNADPKAISYISSVQNRIRSYEGVHSPLKKTQEISPSLSILPQPIKSETRNVQDIKPSILPSRPFTLTPMPSNSNSAFHKNSPLSQIQATVQNIQSAAHNQNQGIMTSLLKSSLQPSKVTTHPKPEVSITSVPVETTAPTRHGKPSVLTKKIQENLRNLASRSQVKQPNQARAVILNRTVGGQKQSLVQVTTGGKTIHLTLSQFRRIQHMQMKKKQYLEHQAKMLKTKEDQSKSKAKNVEDGFSLKILSPELEIQEVKPTPVSESPEVFPLISEVRSLAGEEPSWDNQTDSEDSFPKLPKTLSVSVTKIPLPDSSANDQPIE